ncbi:MAG: hypothetical protein GY756_10045 [bacterium]|nr:hypothetical protein [bacterium]
MRKINLVLFLVFFVSILVFGAANFSSTFQTNTKPQIFRTNIQTSAGARGKYLNTTVPNIGYQVFVTGISKPTDNIMVTGNFILYADLSNGAVSLNWIAKDVSGNITSGNIGL